MTICNTEQLKYACENKYLVIKQDYSDSMSCTFMPGWNCLLHVMEKDRQMSIEYSGIKTIPTPSWMGQVFNPQLAGKGELWVYVVGGILQYMIHT